MAAPPIRISLLDKAGKAALHAKVADPLDARVPPGAVRYFAITIPDPPAGASELEIGLRPGRASAPAVAAAPSRRRRAAGARRRPSRSRPTAPTPSTTRKAMSCTRDPAVLLAEAEIAQRVEALAARIAPRIDDETVAVCLLTGGLWFAADLTRALARAGPHRPLRRPVAGLLRRRAASRAAGARCAPTCSGRSPGRKALVVDDVFDTGLSLSEAARLVRDAGASEVLTAVFARKPWPTPAGHRARLRRPGRPRPASWSATAWTWRAQCAACRSSGRWTSFGTA